MSITQLRAFHHVAAAGGYSQAARETAISQSNLSNQVRQLEAASGLSLFERGPRGVTLTDDGARLYQVTSRLFATLAEAAAILKSRKIDGGQLRVAADGVVHSLPILRALRRRRPNLVFSLQVHNSDNVIEQLLQFRADVGITAELPKDERLRVQPLASMKLGLMVPVEHHWAGQGSLAMRDLAGVNFVLRERGSRTRAVFEQNLAESGAGLGSVLEVSTREGVREAVAAGFGLGVIADLEFGYDTRLRFVPIRDAAVTIDEYVVCMEERRRLPLIDDFFACAQEAFVPAFAPAGSPALTPRASRGRSGPEAA
ncbi:LysR family transcriptional regulator [Ancylobacter oerskovii]|uniref:LysR family transcriptional regulator n=1 Tax=Ancylobacter oerskovii TaxID=459519 RepID=A0ABW4YZQ1_9HYPH|nr:LysR family transcriptional regulator [Ancylobacter oerskovii]MBS7542960.1 LysR family transcriptional regulator [Ancylobacter oerskovii]